jgi:molybdate transport system ATP-binding protein
LADTPHHTLRVTGHRGAIRLDVALDLRAPWTVLFGPSGSGKSTLLRAACGLMPALHTEFHRYENGTARDLTRTPIHQRRIAYAPQGAAIFPHLTVRDNIAYPLNAQSHPKSLSSRPERSEVERPLYSPQREPQARAYPYSDLVDSAIDLFLLGGYKTRHPRTLSGGERQRVALARAFAVPNAKLMLLDEPFTGIDRRMRDDLLARMRDRAEQLAIPVVSVTHDVEEALLLEAEVIRIDAGRALTRGPAREVLYEERTRMKAILD